jgi:hypothetical protein
MQHTMQHACHERLVALSRQGKPAPTDQTSKQHLHHDERRQAHGQ